MRGKRTPPRPLCRATAAKLLMRDRRIAVNIAKPPELLRKR
jgi:hypothetical protein